MTALLVFTRPGEPAGTEIYSTGLIAHPGDTPITVTLSSADRLAKGVDPGRWLVTATGFDEGTGTRHETYPGHLLTIGSISVTLTSVGAIPSQIAKTDDLSVDFNFSNSGDTADRVTALLVFTPPGQTTGVEVYTTNLLVNPGSMTQTVTLTSAQRLAKGVNPGRWLVTATGFDGLGTRLLTVPGHLLTIGSIIVTLNSIGAIPTGIDATADLSVDFNFENTGDTPDRVTALLVFTRPGDTTGIEIYTTHLLVDVGSVTHTVTLTSAQRMAKGVTPGRYLVTATGFDGGGTRLSTFPGQPLSIGHMTVSLSSISAIPTDMHPSDTLSVDFNFSNSGDATDSGVSALLIFTPSGGTTGIEFYKNNLSVPPGSTTHTMTLTQAQREAKGVGVGHWRVTATAFNGAGTRLETFAGNSLDID
ncbi:MAG: hypothetical protein HY211_08255 [Candidatus Omnitrophica bacterium]|nr:hypothetical protein [Candidatus Omnitrophota bacterium]